MRPAKGQTVVETAIMIPILLVFLFAIIDFGRALYTKNTLISAARSGARVAAVTSPLRPVSPTLLSASTGEPATTMQSQVFNGLVDESVTYQLQIRDAGGTALPGPAISGNAVRITLTLPEFETITPIYRLLAIITNSTTQNNGTMTITGEASMRYE